MYEEEKSGLDPMLNLIVVAGGIWLIGAVLLLVAAAMGQGMV